jgi:hypothetical protein
VWGGGRRAAAWEGAAEERLRGGRAEEVEEVEEVGLHDLELGEEPRLACVDLELMGFRTDAPLSAEGELEVLHRIGEVRGRTEDFRGSERLVEEAAGRSDEHPALAVLDIARHFAHEHDPRLAPAFAEHHLRRVASRYRSQPRQP